MDFLGGSTDPVVGIERDGVGVVSYNRPHKHNALNDEASARFREIVADFLATDTVNCLLLRGEGRSFSSGRDVTELGQRPDGQSDEEYIHIAQQGKVVLADTPKPVVAALHGHALGGALETALLADIRIAAPDLSAGLPEVRHGLVPDTGGTQLLADAVGPGRAKYLIMTGERLDGRTALDWGLVDLLIEDGADLDAAAHDLARRIAANPPRAVRSAKSLIDRDRRRRLHDTLQAELDAQVRLFETRKRT